MRPGAVVRAVAARDPDAGTQGAGARYARGEGASRAVRLPFARVLRPGRAGTDSNHRRAAARGLAAFRFVLAGGHVTTRPPSLAEARQRVHDRAARYGSRLWRDLCLGWGYFHLVITAVLRAVEWVTGTFPRLAAATTVIVLVRIFLF